MEMEKEKELYFAKVKWYDEYNDEENTSCLFVFGTDYADAVENITKDLRWITNIEIKKISSTGLGDINCIYVPDDEKIIQAIMEENDY
jgi:hypothetical protein